ncbi:MAG: hypothetical protein ACYCO0_03120 [Candidatus Micrarchaeaceae archaeon]
MSFYGLVISIVMALCILQVAVVSSGMTYVNAINTAYYQISHEITKSIPAP